MAELKNFVTPKTKYDIFVDRTARNSIGDTRLLATETNTSVVDAVNEVVYKGVFAINVTGSEKSGYTADKTGAEVVSAVERNATIVAVADTDVVRGTLPLTTATEESLLFCSTTSESFFEIRLLYSSESCEVSNVSKMVAASAERVNFALQEAETAQKMAENSVKKSGWNGNKLLGTDDDGNVVEKEGSSGKSAYAYAQEGGFTGTEQEFADKLGGPLLVEVTDNGDGTGTSETTYNDLITAYSQGRPIYVYVDKRMIPLRSVDENGAFDFGWQDVYVDSDWHRIVTWAVVVIWSAEEIFVQIQQEDEAESLVITISGNEITGFKKDKSVEEIMDALEANQTVYVNEDNRGVFPLLFVDFNSGLVFGSQLLSYTDGKISLSTIAYTIDFEENVKVDMSYETISSFHNPNAMKINGTSYNGSEEVDFTSTINSMIDAKINALNATGVSY